MKVVKKLFLLVSCCGGIFAGTSVIASGQKNIGYDRQLNHQRLLDKGSVFALSPVIKALNQFDRHPLLIPWLRNKDPLPASSWIVTASIRYWLIQKDTTGLIDDNVSSQLKFGNEKIVPNATVTTTVSYRGELTKIRISEDPSVDQVVRALANFKTANPLRMKSLENAQPITIATHPKIYSAFKQALIVQDKTKTITTRVIEHIRVGLKSKLILGVVSSVRIIYYDLWYKWFKIKVLEGPSLVSIISALKKFNSNNPLNIPSLGWYPIDPIYANSYRPSLFLRKTLVQQDTTLQITSAVAQDITFGKNLLHRSRRPSTVIATYQGHSTPIQVNEADLNWRPGILRYGFDNSHWTFDAVAAFWKTSPSASKRYYAQYDVTMFEAGWVNLYNYVFKQSYPWILPGLGVIHWMESYAAGFASASGAYYNFIDVIGKGLYDVQWPGDAKVTRDFALHMSDLIKFLKEHKTISQKQKIHVWFFYRVFKIVSGVIYYVVNSGAEFI